MLLNFDRSRLEKSNFGLKKKGKNMEQRGEWKMKECKNKNVAFYDIH